jgi:hypothetical protein
MMRLPKSVFSFGAVVLSAAILMLAVPRAAHAVAAALVQVTNTASNPAMTQSINQQAAQQVEISCGGYDVGLIEPCGSISPTGVSSSNYVVPASQFLMITGVDVTPASLTACSAPSFAQLSQNGFQRAGWGFTGLNTLHFAYPNGFVLAPGSVLTQGVVTGSACGATVYLYGYLTTN